METMNKTKIDYPCQWSYRIIGDDEQLLSDAATAAVGDKKFTLSVSNSSSGGKYHSLNMELVVDDEAERLAIFNHLKKDDAIKFVL